MNGASTDALRLHLMRQEAGLSLAELARRCRISGRRLESIERGDQRATDREGRKVETALNEALISGSRSARSPAS
jgi:ribosome-binding protein aMBF1 (putative translation factor)